MSATPIWTWGDERLWCFETLNHLLAVSPRHVAVQGHESVIVWSRETGEVVSRAKGFAVWRHAYFDDEDALHLANMAGSRVLRLGGSALEEAPDGGVRASWASRRSGAEVELAWHDGTKLVVRLDGRFVTRVSFARDARRAALMSAFETAVYEAERGTPLRVFEGCGQAALSCDGRELAMCHWRGSRLLFADVESGEVTGAEGFVGAITSLGFSPDGAHLAAASTGQFRVFDASTREMRFAVEGVVERFAWSRDGRHMIAFEDGCFVRRDAYSGAVIARREMMPEVRRVSAATFVSDVDARVVALTLVLYPGGLMLVPPDDAIVLDALDGTTVATVPLAGSDASGALDTDPWDERLIALSDDGSHLALGGAEVRVYELTKGCSAPVERVPSTRWVGFRGEGLALGEDREASVLNRLAGGAVVDSKRLEGVRGVAFAADRSLVAIARHDAVTVFDASLEERAVVRTRRPASAIALSPDGATLVIAEGAPMISAWRIGGASA